MTRKSDANDKHWSQIRLFGRTFQTLDRIRIRGRQYLLLERLSTDRRERYLAFDPAGGPRGSAVMILRLPRSEVGTKQHLAVLQRQVDCNENLPAILNFAVQHDFVLVVLRWVQGVSLAQCLSESTSRRERQISPTIAIQRIRGLAHGLSRWHRRGQWVHGDIKPDNIIASTNTGRFVLIDFGSAWCDQSVTTRDRGDGFNPFYAAPEMRLTTGLIDSRSDQFSLSVVLYQLLTGQLPYEGLGGKALTADDSAVLTPPSRLMPDRDRLPGVILQGIDRVVGRGLALHPDQRYPTSTAWLKDLDAVDLDIRRPTNVGGIPQLLTRVMDWFCTPGKTSGDQHASLSESVK